MARTDPQLRVAVDVGGTFIDVVVIDEATGELTVDKQPAVPDRLADELMISLSRLPGPPDAIRQFFHGSTVALNAVLERRGADVGLITTRGFRDVLELGRGARPDVYDWLTTPPVPLVPRRRRREVTERTAADGSVLIALDLDELDREVDALVALGVDAIAVCFLHSYANPKHESLAVERIRQRHRRVRVTAASDAAAEWREFERTSTAVVNAFVQPTFADYLDGLTVRLRAGGVTAPIAVMQSNGGVMEAARATTLPVRTLMSGPAGGAIGGRSLAQELGIDDMICADVGGTSFDVVLVEGGQILERSESNLGGFPVLAPFIDIVSVGAGGGSVAWVDEAGSLRVGPRSVGADPGPACFGRGGTTASVTDAQLVLGRLDPERFLGSRMQLDVGAAERALLDDAAEPLGLDLASAAAGVVAIAEASMGHAVHAVTVERGRDPRDFVLLSYGGAGGLFAAAVAEGLEVPRVVIPRAPSTFSAWGILSSDYREDASLTRVRPLEPASVAGIRGDLSSLDRHVSGTLAAHGFDPADIVLAHRVDLRFAGQEHTVSVLVDLDPDRSGGDDEAFVAVCRERFVALHRRLFGHGDPSTPAEVVTARAQGVGMVQRPRWTPWEVRMPGRARTVRRVHFSSEGFVDTPVYDREVLAVDQTIVGPAVVEEWSTTIVVPPGWSAVVDRLGDLVMEAT